MQRWILASLCTVAFACSGARSDGLDNTTLPSVGEDAEVDAAAEEDAGEVVDVPDEDAGEPVVDAGEDATQGPELVLCGNGELDPDEACDDGSANSDTEPGACRTNCQGARCGDGTLDEGEECDNGAANNDNDADACRTTCVAPRCGDNVVDNGEECDTGADRSDTVASACRLRCVSARCGDGVVDTSEGCDDGNTVDTDACRNSCRSASCGDGALNPGEECDDSNNTDGDGCQANCRNPRCGDGVRDSGEQCDDGNTASNDGCRADCRNGCTSSAACSDGVYCNGAEACVDGLCQSSAPPSSDDGVACTVDACDEGSDGATHTPNDGLCTLRPQTCAGGVVTADSQRCTTSGCASTPWMRTCADQANECLQVRTGYQLRSYRPACNAAGNDCGLPVVDGTLDCPNPAPRCDGRVAVIPTVSCNAAAGTCPVSENRDNCARFDVPGACAPRNVSWSRTVGQCTSTGACAGQVESETCDAPPANSCANGQVTSYTRACSAADGCQPPAPSAPTTCSVAAPSCVNVGAGPIATHYVPTCDNATTCNQTGTAVQELCTSTPTCSLSRGAWTLIAGSGRCNSATGTCVPGTTTTCQAVSSCGVRNQICGGCLPMNANGAPAHCAAVGQQECRVCPNGTTCTMVNGAADCI